MESTAPHPPASTSSPPPPGHPEGGPQPPNPVNPALPVIVVLAEKTATLDEVLSLRVGSVIAFRKFHTDPLDILVSNRRIGAGRTVRIGEHFGVHVREIGTPEETMEKLG